MRFIFSAANSGGFFHGEMVVKKFFAWLNRNCYWGHSFGRWMFGGEHRAKLAAKRGSGEDVIVQARECVRCNYLDVRELV